jgi:archaeosine-15-forming tRNA-guanine transglycosylase
MDWMGWNMKLSHKTVELLHKLFRAKKREVIKPDEFEDWKKKGYWIPSKAEGLGE